MKLPIRLQLNKPLSTNYHGPKGTTLRSCWRVYKVAPWGRVLYRYAADGSNRSWWLYYAASPLR